MPSHKETKILSYTPAQIYALVIDIERYPEFLPWCLGCRIFKHGDDYMLADMLVGYKIFREKFTSQVNFTPHERVQVEYQNGPLKHLKNDWHFKPHGKHECELHFQLEFEFQSKLLQRIAETFFNEALKRMVNAFEKRAKELYN